MSLLHLLIGLVSCSASLHAAPPVIAGVFNQQGDTTFSPGIRATVFFNGGLNNASSAAVFVGGVNVPVVDVQQPATPQGVTFYVPTTFSAGNSNVVISRDGESSAPFPITLTTFAPAFFVDYSAVALAPVFATVANVNVSAANPARPGRRVTFSVSGIGETSPPSPPGPFVPGTIVYTTLATPSLTVGGAAATVVTSRLATGTSSGVYALDVLLSPNTPTGNQPVSLSVGGFTSKATVNKNGTNHALTVFVGAAEPCTYTLSSTSRSIASSGGQFNATVTTQAGCPWAIVPNDSFIIAGTVNRDRSSTGQFPVTVEANTTGVARIGTVTVAGQVLTINQAGRTCLATLDPPRGTIPFTPGFSNIMLALSSPDCPWTVSSNVPWLSISTPSSGSGSATVTFNWTANPSAFARSGSLTIAGQQFTITQAGSDCGTLSLSDTDLPVPAAGGAFSVNVLAPAGCPYTAIPGGGFLNITAGATGSGFGRVDFTVQPNPGASERTGTITVGAQIITVRQAGNATPSLVCDVPEVTSPATLRSTGRTELLSPLNIRCSGRTGANTYTADFIVALNTNVTNRLSNATTESTNATLLLPSGNTIAGRIDGPNTIRFPNVPLANGEPEIDSQIVISNIRADASALGTGSTAQLVFATVSVQSPLSIPVTNTTRLVGQSIAAFASQLGTVRAGPSAGQLIVPVRVEEGFATVFRLQDGDAADTPTRIRVRITNIPANVSLFAPVQSDNGRARLMSADDNGAGGTPVTGAPRAGGTYSGLAVNGGIANATWEVTAVDAASIESLVFSLLVENPNQVSTDAAKVEAALAPVSEVAIASTAAPVPRFLDPAQPLRIVNLRVQTRIQGSLARPETLRSPVAQGTSVSFGYSITNDSDQTARNVVLRNPAAAGLAQSTCTASVGVCDSSSTGARVRFGDVAPGATVNATVVASVGSSGTCPNCINSGTVLGNIVTAGSDQVDPDLGNNTAENTIEVLAPCTYGFSRSLITAGPAGGTFRVDVTTGPSCEFSLLNPVAGVTVTPGGTSRGSTTFTISVAPNTTPASNTGILTVAGNSLRVTQAAQNCAVTLLAALSTLPSQAGSYTAQISTNNGCSWEAQSLADWLRVGVPASGSGSGTVSFTVQANPSTIVRSGIIEVAGEQLQIVQNHGIPFTGTCSYAVSPTTLSLAGAGGAANLSITTGAGCPWTASSNVSWASVQTVSGNGGGPVVITAPSNTSGAVRNGTLRIAGQDITITQPQPPVAGSGLRFISMNPCRLMETRAEYNFQGRTGAFGPPFLAAGETRTLTVANSNVCQVPANAKAYVLNVTVVPRGGVDFVTLFPGGEQRPNFWSIRSPDGQAVANSAIVKSGNGAIQVYTSSATDLIIDISGYMTDDTQQSNLVYYPLSPCRVVDTRAEYRQPAGPFGPPSLLANQTRRFRFPATPYCQVPNAAAYSVTITAVPPGILQYLTAWPAGGGQPNVSNLNSFAGRVLANTMIIPASGDGSLDVFTPDATDFLVDINGYFAPDDGISGLYYFPVTQCRVSDSQAANGPFGGPVFGDDTARTVAVPGSTCTGLPTSAKAYVVNATAIPNGNPMPFLTAYPTGQPRPNASVLNAFQGQIVTNTAIIPAGTNGSIDVYAFRRTHVVIDVSGYFGR